MLGKVVSINCDIFFVDTGETVLQAKLRKKVNFQNADVLVGDNVEIETGETFATIENVFSRKNKLLRPNVANIDNAAILITLSPPPDLMLVDKIIINCIHEEINPIVVVSKADVVDNGFVDRIITNYTQVCTVKVISSYSGEGLKDLAMLFTGKTTCLAGQSAVGKSSLINAFKPTLNIEVDQVSKRSGRGKHTTRKSHIIRLDENSYIIDSSGFSLFDLDFIQPQQLRLYYPDFAQYLNKCRFNACIHANEPQCVVREAANNGELSKERYERYLLLLKQLQINEKHKYS